MLVMSIVSAVTGMIDPSVASQRAIREAEKTRQIARRDEAITLFIERGLTLVVASVATIVVLFAATTGVRLVDRFGRRKEVHADPETALYPMISGANGTWTDYNERDAQKIAALTAGSRRSANGAAVGKIIDGKTFQITTPDEPLALPAASALTPSQMIIDVDPKVDPHWLLVGGTGSGKSIASYSLLNEMAKRHPLDFVILDPGGVGWGGQATATDTRDVAETIIRMKEMMRYRQGLLHHYDVPHISDLNAEDFPFMMIVLEEFDTLLNNLRIEDNRLRLETIVALREMAAAGRKAGMCLFTVSTTGTTDVFDASIRKNVRTVLLFQNEHTVAEQWRLKNVDLPALKPGRAYDVNRARFVQFPRVERPMLTAPLVSRGPDTVDTVVPDAVYPPNEGVSPGIPVFYTDPEARKEPYTQEQKRHIVERFLHHGQKVKPVQRELYPHLKEGGWWWEKIKEVVIEAGYTTSG